MPGLACPSDLPRLLEGRDVRTTTKNSIERSSNFPVKPEKEAVREEPENSERRATASPHSTLARRRGFSGFLETFQCRDVVGLSPRGAPRDTVWLPRCAHRVCGDEARARDRDWLTRWLLVLRCARQLGHRCSGVGVYGIRLYIAYTPVLCSSVEGLTGFEF